MFSIIGKQHIPGIKALADMEYRGVKIDLDYLSTLEIEVGHKYRELEYKLQKLTMVPDFKVNSPKQVANAIHSTFGITTDIATYTATGGIQVDEDALLKYSKHADSTGNTDAKEFIDSLTSFRDISKTLNTTLKNFRKHTAYDGRLRTSYHLNGTTTGRLSSSSLNLQNIPHYGGGVNIKKLIIPDSTDRVFVNVDIKSAEIICLLAYAKEESLINAIKNGRDFHCTTASEVFFYLYKDTYATQEDFYNALYEAHNATDPTDAQKKLCQLRKNTKAITFGLVYGITKYGLSRDLKCSEDEAQSYIDSFFKRYPRIKAYMDRVEKELRDNREVQSLTFRKRRFPRYDLNRGRANRQAVNFCVQNVSSDLVVRVISNMYTNIGEELQGILALTVHDSLLFSIPENNLPKVQNYLQRMIVDHVRDNYKWMVLDFNFDWEYGNNYGELSKYVS